MTTAVAASSRLPLLAWLCLGSLYLVWGSTYLGIRFALEAYPPLFFPGVRFVIAGTLLFGFLRWRGAALPTARQLTHSAAIGFLLLNVGNGAVVFAQRSVGSGLASMSWAFGSVWSRHIDLPKGPMSTACQMLVAGALFLIASALRGEPWTLSAPPKAMAAVAYLTLFGSLLAFSAYIWLVQNVSPQLATSYAYVNPVIALLLGMALAGESVTAHEGVAIVLVLAGVVLIVLNSRGVRAAR